MSATLSKTLPMMAISGGRFTMGSDGHYPEERPAHPTVVAPFLIDRTAVTNSEFARFVDATDYRTVAERALDPADYPGLAPELAVPGSLVFTMTNGPVDTADPRSWWRYVPGASWRHPDGPTSTLAGLADHPVVQVAYEDAAAYAAWVGKALPSEAEWEFAARGGLDGREFAWGDELAPDGVHLANTWQGPFPWRNLATDGYTATSPVTAFPANEYGLFDMIGNVWEWTADWYAGDHLTARSSCCLPADPAGRMNEPEYDPAQPHIRIPRKVVKGGSFLCSPSYCRRYRPAARQPQMIDTAMSHLGFRCVRRP